MLQKHLLLRVLLRLANMCKPWMAKKGTGVGDYKLHNYFFVVQSHFMSVFFYFNSTFTVLTFVLTELIYSYQYTFQSVIFTN